MKNELELNPFGGWMLDDEEITPERAKKINRKLYKRETTKLANKDNVTDDTLKEFLTPEDYEILGDPERKTNLKVVSMEKKKSEPLEPETFFNDERKFVPSKLGKYINDNFNTFYDGKDIYYYKKGVFIPQGENRLNKLIQDLLIDYSNMSRKREVVDWLRTENDISFNEGKKINPDDGLINVKNGLIDLNTGQLTPHTDKRISTIQLPVKYDPNANDPIIDEFIKSVVPADTVNLVYEMIGYALTMNTKGQKAFMLHGSGANGKSVMIDMISHLVGESNISNISLQDLDENRFKVAGIKDKLINTFDDLPDKPLKQNGNFKASVTGGRIEAEFKGKDSFKLIPFAKHIYSANAIPRSYDNTDAYFRRWIIIPFPNTFKGKDRDENLLHKLTTDEALSTLLNKALEGIQRLVSNGFRFSENQSTKEMLNQYIQQSDNIVSFIDECCQLGNDNKGKPMKVTTTKLYDAYKEYCSINGYRASSNGDFNKHIENKFDAEKKRGSIKGSRKLIWSGLGLFDEDQ
ncbi:DNA primase family protein [Halobacillus amylolyticus]|uniref:Phage/plasmid primase, P4 family n=1 Tax=Halobacillus amylolyticus TaxID=2932259 RepID=A0ABY4HFH1_9BACI|nr:DNA primase family protein [Halobacillus amylolyticus]UOR12185.1 phage/plasmid primase, P4 family [Halobacillus amylolyticus]